MKRELGLDCAVARFSVVATYSMVWQFRAQAPAGNGTADVSTVHALRLSPGEEEAVVLDPKEYSESRSVAVTRCGQVRDPLAGSRWRRCGSR